MPASSVLHHRWRTLEMSALGAFCAVVMVFVLERRVVRVGPSRGSVNNLLKPNGPRSTFPVKVDAATAYVDSSLSKLRMATDAGPVNDSAPPLGVDEGSLDCDTIAIHDDKLPDVDSYPVPRKCLLGIVAVGMPRAGSSFQSKLVGKVLRVGLSDDMIVHYYWDLHKHKEMQSPELENHLEEATKALLAVDESKVLIVKTHEYKPALFRLCRKTVVLSIRRDLALTSRSIMLSEWVAPDAFSDLIALHQRAIGRRACWIKQAQLKLEIDYDVLLANPRSFIVKVADLTNLLLTSDMIETVMASGLGAEANLGFPSTKHLSLAPQQLETIERALRDGVIQGWQRRFGYKNTA